MKLCHRQPRNLRASRTSFQESRGFSTFSGGGEKRRHHTRRPESLACVIADWQTGPYGELNPKVWSDVDDTEMITSLPEDNLHRPADRILQAAAIKHGDRLKTAVICPSGIYGPGKGSGNTRSLLVPEMCENMIELGHAFYAQSGANRRSWVHVDDLMKVYLKLVEAAVTGGGDAVWGKEVSSQPDLPAMIYNLCLW